MLFWGLINLFGPCQPLDQEDEKNKSEESTVYAVLGPHSSLLGSVSLQIKKMRNNKKMLGEYRLRIFQIFLGSCKDPLLTG